MRVIISAPGWLPRLAVAALVVCMSNPRVGVAQPLAKTALAPATYFFIVCTHDETYDPSTYICPDTANALRTFSGRAVKRATLTLTVEGLGDMTMVLPKGTDALFFSDHALTKFLAPYYDTAKQEKKAAAVRAFAYRVTNTSTGKAKAKQP